MSLRKNNLFKITFVFFITTIISSPLSAQEVIDRVVAIVNDDLITLSELRETALSINPTSKEQMDERTVLNQMIESKLFEQEANRRGITVSKEELDASIEQVRNKYNMNEDQMEEVLKKQNLTPESFREQWRVQTLGNKLLESQLKNKIVVTNDEIEEYYKENYGTIEYSGNYSGVTEKTEEEVEIAHILISPDTPNAQDRAVEVAELAKSGNDFAILAREYSDDNFTADKGGNLGSFKKGDLIEPLEIAVERTPEGKVSGPVQSPAGYHIIKVLNRTKPSSDEKEEVSENETYISDSDREEIRQILHRQKAEEQLKTWLQGVREKAYVEIKL
ncbi:MAG: peptidylprolyl isomerase [Deltaproteobacteria bacterium]|nr:peptidylprolyl isomerase [Deltaproteobacteria bacterium]